MYCVVFGHTKIGRGREERGRLTNNGEEWEAVASGGEQEGGDPFQLCKASEHSIVGDWRIRGISPQSLGEKKP